MLDGVTMNLPKIPGPLPVLLLATVVAGSLDISAAILYWGVQGAEPYRILQGIAGGLLGKATFDGGFATAALGGVLHYSIMAAMAVVYFLAARRLPGLDRRPYAWGALYGVVLLLVMDYVVLPLSAYPFHPSFNMPWFLCDLGSHVFFVGIPIALFARLAMGRPPSAGT